MFLNCYGGVILFRCEVQYLSILPRGVVYTEDHKKEFIKWVEEIIKEIDEELKMGEDIQVSFVPVLESYENKKEKYGEVRQIY